MREAARLALIDNPTINGIYLECEPGNEKVHKFYEKIGFENLVSEEVERRFDKVPKWRVYYKERKILGL